MLGEYIFVYGTKALNLVPDVNGYKYTGFELNVTN